jgi:hypothetical protein
MDASEIFRFIDTVITHPFILLLLGLATHFIKTFAQIKNNTGRNVKFRTYYLSNPYQTLLCIIGALAGYAVFAGMNELTKLNAFMIGYMADSMMDILGQRSGIKSKGVQNGISTKTKTGDQPENNQ